MVSLRGGLIYRLELCKITHINSAEVIRRIEADGWFKVGQKGSHVQFKHPSKPGRVTVVHPKRDIDINTG